MDVRNLTRPAVVGIRQAGQPVSGVHHSGTTPAANGQHTEGNGLRTLAAAIDDWLGPEVQADRRATIHAAFHGVVSTPFLLLDHSAMTPELVQAMPLAVWKALADMGLEQGCAINSVCFPVAMTVCPAGLSQLGELAYIELPDYAPSEIDLRGLEMANSFHLSLQGSSTAITVHAKNPASICVTGNANALDLHYYDDFGGRKKTKYLAAQVEPEPPVTIEAARTALVQDNDVAQKMPLPVTLASASIPPFAGEAASEIDGLLAPLRKMLAQPLREREKIRFATVTYPEPLIVTVKALLLKDQEVVQTFFQFLASVKASNRFKLEVFSYILHYVSNKLSCLRMSSYLDIAPFIVGQVLSVKIDHDLKFKLIDRLILSAYLNAVLKSSLSDTDMVALINLPDWSTDVAVMSSFAERIFSSKLGWPSIKAIMDHQINQGKIFDRDGGISLLETVLNSNLSRQIKSQIATASHYSGWRLGLCALHKTESVQSHLALILNSSLDLKQMIEICRAPDFSDRVYLCSLFSRIASQLKSRPGKANEKSKKTEKARIYMETILASNLPDLSKYELLAASDTAGIMAIDHAVNGGASYAVTMYNTTIENSTLAASIKRELMRKGGCLMQ